MLNELIIEDLGIIERCHLELGPGMTVLSGETGAGKTMLVEALGLLLGGKPDATLVRSGSERASVQARFASSGDEPDDELILARSVDLKGRSKAFLDGRMASVATVAERGLGMVEVHGQHAHQALVSPSAQRQALDAFGRIDPGPLNRARTRLRAAQEELARLGGQAGSREAELALADYQLTELDGAALSDPEEEASLRQEELRLAEAGALRQAGALALCQLAGIDALEDMAGDASFGPIQLAEHRGSLETGAGELLGSARAALQASGAFVDLVTRLRQLSAELADTTDQLRAELAVMVDNPARLALVQARRHQLSELRRKYGAADLFALISKREEIRAAIKALRGNDRRAAELQSLVKEAAAEVAAAESQLAAARAAAAPDLARQVGAHLRRLGMAAAAIAVETTGRAGENVSMLLAANTGEPALALAKVASGGELSRAMLALRLVLTNAPGTMVFDEVDAGVGGEAALAVGSALASLARNRQVLVVTHLAQVAAFADTQICVRKVVRQGRSVAEMEVVADEARVAELARMLSGHPSSEVARRHAQELLSSVAMERLVVD